MRHVTALLDQEKFPTLRLGSAGSIDHKYEDKYDLVEFVVNSGMAASSNTLMMLGLQVADLKTLTDWVVQGKKSVFLKFESDQNCIYSHMKSYDEESSVKKVEKKKSKMNSKMREDTITQTIVTTVTEHYWTFEQKYRLIACRGVSNGSDDCIELSRSSTSMELKTKSDKMPPRTLGSVILPTFEVDISTLLKSLSVHINQKVVPTFKIDRNASSCKTPSHNEEVNAAMDQFINLHHFTESISNYFVYQLLPLSTQQNSKVSFLTASNVFNPVVPIFVDCSDIEEDISINAEDSMTNETPSICVSSGSVAVSESTMIKLLHEQLRTLKQTALEVSDMFDCGVISSTIHTDSGDGQSEWCNPVISRHTASFIVSMMHLRELSHRVHNSVFYVEDLLRKQLSTAIGKEISPADLSAYMKFHNQQLFKLEYRPQQMTHAVRRSSAHSPEGKISIEGGYGHELETPVHVVSKSILFGVTPCGGNGHSNSSSGDLATHASSDGFVTIPIDATTKISLGGERYVHAHLQHIFSGKSRIPLYLTAQARQFSSFILLIGRVPSATSFDPMLGIIVKNKDDLRIPLDVAIIPSAKEFKDAIASLSSEQQQFAEAFRKLQLQSTLFGVCVIQIKPQMEKVLNLPPDSLTKEIELTENLMEMFIKYQIPPDMLSYEGGNVADPSFDSKEGLSSKQTAINEVKANVALIHDMISRAKEKEIEHKEQVDAMNRPSAYPTLAPTVAKQSMMGSSASFAMAAESGEVHIAGERGGVAAGGSVRQAKYFAGRPSGMPSSVPTLPDSGQTMRTASSQPATAGDSGTQSSSPQSSSTTPSSIPSSSTGTTGGAGGVDVTSLPALLACKFEEDGQDTVIRPAIITAGNQWQFTSQPQLLGGTVMRSLNADDQRTEKLQAFGLLDALTKSGALSILDSTIHVIISSAHVFDKSLVNTIIQDNIDPIKKLEQSMLIMAATIHELPAAELVETSQVQRVSTSPPQSELEVKK